MLPLDGWTLVVVATTHSTLANERSLARTADGSLQRCRDESLSEPVVGVCLDFSLHLVRKNPAFATYEFDSIVS